MPQREGTITPQKHTFKGIEEGTYQTFRSTKEMKTLLTIMNSALKNLQAVDGIPRTIHLKFRDRQQNL